MGWRGTALLFVLAVVLAVAYLATTPEQHVQVPNATLLGEPRYRDPSEPIKRLLEFEAAEVSRIVLTSKGKEVTRARDAAGWGGQDSRAIEDFLTALKDAVEITTIEATPSTLHDYGLHAPERRATVEMRGGGTLDLLIGDRNPSGTSVYVRVGNGPVALAGALVIWEFDKAFTALGGGTPGHG